MGAELLLAKTQSLIAEFERAKSAANPGVVAVARVNLECLRDDLLRAKAEGVALAGIKKALAAPPLRLGRGWQGAGQWPRARG